MVELIELGVARGHAHRAHVVVELPPAGARLAAAGYASVRPHGTGPDEHIGPRFPGELRDPTAIGVWEESRIVAERIADCLGRRGIGSADVIWPGVIQIGESAECGFLWVSDIAVARIPKSSAVPGKGMKVPNFVPSRWQLLHLLPRISTVYAFQGSKSDPTKEYGWSLLKETSPAPGRALGPVTCDR